MLRTSRLLAVASSIVFLAACGGGDTATTTADAGPAATDAAVATAGGEQTPDAGGSVITVEMITDDQGNNVFRPALVEAKRGDVVRFTLLAGVHNVHFLADSNPTAKGLPPAGELLQLPGQTYDLKVTFEPGRYFFQCDPHALLGMVGHLEVE
ncbi:MAG: plastocyanin/azurin family copper-binding protein [Gemmatimonadaceae bacterium]